MGLSASLASPSPPVSTVNHQPLLPLNKFISSSCCPYKGPAGDEFEASQLICQNGAPVKLLGQDKFWPNWGGGGKGGERDTKQRINLNKLH